MLWLDSDLGPNGDVYVHAAQTALMRLDLELAECLADAAIRAGEGPEAQILRAHALILLNRGQEADRVLDSFVGQGVAESVRLKALHLRAANLLWPLGRPEDSWNVIEKSLAQSGDGRGDHLRAFRSVQLAMAACPREAGAVTGSLDRSKLEALPALVAVWAEVIALGDLGYPQRAAAAAADGHELAVGSAEAAYQGIGLTEFQVAALLVGGCVRQATRAAQAAYQRFANLPGMAGSVAAAVRGMAALGEGDLVTALQCLRAAVAEFEAHGDTTGVLYRFMIVYTQALARSGDVDEAVNALHRMEATRHPSSVFVESDRLLSTAWVAAARGWTSQAREIAMEGAGFARSHGQLSREVMCLQAAIQFGETKAASRLEDLAGRVEGPRAAVAARYANALAHDCGDELSTVSRDFEVIGDRLAAADALAQACLAFGRHDRRGAALSSMDRAHGIMRGCGAVSPAVLAALSPLKLTAREREVGTLVAQGLANKEIARALTMSVRTVEGHIYRVTSKLGVANRTELSSLFKEFGNVHADDGVVDEPVQTT